MNKLFSALVHGLTLPSEILGRPGLSERLRGILEPLLALESEPSEALEFYRNYKLLTQKPEFEDLLISNRIDLSELELAYLFRLAELGVRIRFEFPVDSSGQGFSLPVNYLAQRIEQRHDLRNLEIAFKPFEKPKRLLRYEAPDLVQEARLIGQIVAGYGADKKIAVAMRTLDKRALIIRDALRAHDLDFPILALPDLIGQKYDLVVIADCIHGRLTLSREPDWPLRDSDCFEINRLMGRQVLRRFEEDPLEPSLFPARQALEPMWFLGACSAASDLLVLTSSSLDDNGQAQTTSELAKLEWLGTSISVSDLERPLSKLEALFQAFRRGEVERLPVQIDKAIFRERFADKLGLTEQKPMSATLVEALARCHFQAFIEKLLKIELKAAQGHDVDTRLVGQVAHEALEKYYRDGRAISKTLQQPAPETMHPGVWQATMLWLGEALERLISNLEKNPPFEEASPVEFEARKRPFKLQIGQDLIFIGGVIDRVDRAADLDIVVDYKLSTLSTLRMKFAQKEILKTHFQIPIYLRLLNSSRQLLGYPISIRDGAPGPLIDMTERLSELDEALQGVIEPVLKGHISQDIGDNCENCRLKRVCRV